jgi:protein tyrosine phosphatase
MQSISVSHSQVIIDLDQDEDMNMEIKTGDEGEQRFEDDKDQLEGALQNMNDDMHSTFLNNNEQIIADLAHLEMEQEKAILRIIYNTFQGNSGLVEFEDL